ncbi:serine/threonine-protein kinase TNNI3K-like [Stylophora pistillata]|nr:serine/threonine-protein kinase TNNI3K-like [Stylophora pistillata]
MKQEVARLQSQLRKKELREARIVKEMEQREKDSHRELEEMAQQLRNVTKKVRDLKYVKEELLSVGKQPHEKDEPMSILKRQVAILKDQLRARDHEISELQTTLSVTRRKLFERKAQESPDWVISRDQIQLTDKRLSHGAWGFWVEGKYFGCVVAVKQIHETVRSPYNHTLFERGMLMASSCRHPCLLQFIGATKDEGSQLYVTELMETSLQALLENQLLCQTEIFVISLDVARALNYLHQKHPCPILHRNVSSSKVLLWRQGVQWRAKLSGCGTVNFKKHTTTMYPGDRRYSAPEAMTANQTEKVKLFFKMTAFSVKTVMVELLSFIFF